MATSISSDIVTSICQDNDEADLLWLGTGHGLCRIDTQAGNLDRVTNAGALNHITSVCDDGQGSLWLGTYGDGLYRFCKSSGEISKASSGKTKITAILQTSAEEVLIGTDKEGIFAVNISSRCCKAHTDQLLQKSLEGAIISTLGKGLSGNLWIGTTDRGLRIYCPDNQHIRSLECDRYNPESLPSNWVRAIAFDQRERVWVGTLTGGVSVHDPHKYKFQHIKGLPSKPSTLQSNVVRCFQEDRHGKLWVGTEGGLDRYDQQNEGFVHYVHDPDDVATINSNMVRGLYIDSQPIDVLHRGNTCLRSNPPTKTEYGVTMRFP